MPTTPVGDSMKADYAADKGATQTAMRDLLIKDWTLPAQPFAVDIPAASQSYSTWTDIASVVIWTPAWADLYASNPFRLRAYIEAYVNANSADWRLRIGTSYGTTVTVSNTSPYAISGSSLLSLPAGALGRTENTFYLQMQSLTSNTLFFRVRDPIWQWAA